MRQFATFSVFSILNPPTSRMDFPYLVRAHSAVGWNCMKSTHSFQRHKPLSHELGSEWVSERGGKNECSRAREQRDQCEASDGVKRCERAMQAAQYSTLRFYRPSTHCAMCSPTGSTGETSARRAWRCGREDRDGASKRESSGMLARRGFYSGKCARVW